MSCDQITCATSSEIKRSPDHHKEKPEYFLPGVELLQANTERGLCCPSAQREQLHILTEQNSFQGRGITCQQYFYYHPFTQLLSTKGKPQSLRTSLLTVFQARDPRKQAYLQGVSKAGAHIMFPQYGSHKQLLSTAPSGSQAQRFETSVLGNLRIPNHLLPNIFKLY